MQNTIQIKNIDPQTYELIHIGNGKLIGHFVMEEDGIFYFKPEIGLWSSQTLSNIVHHLENVNVPFIDQLQQTDGGTLVHFRGWTGKGEWVSEEEARKIISEIISSENLESEE